MDQKLSLTAAGKLLGISGDAVRARTKKNPDLYRLERDNKGKIWVWLDPENLEVFGVRKLDRSDLEGEAFGVRKDAQISALEAALSDMRAERDEWRVVAKALAAKPARRWWQF